MELLEILKITMLTRSIGILTIGTGFILYRRGHLIHPWTFFYLLLMLLGEILSAALPYWGFSNFLILTSSGFLHFAFLIHLFSREFFKLSHPLLLAIIVLGLIPIVAHYAMGWDGTPKQSYQRGIYDFMTCFLGLFGFLLIMQDTSKADRASLWLIGSVLLFFVLDTVWSLGTQYLIHGQKWVVYSFWIFRGLCLQNLYLSIIHYLWKSGKTHKRPSFGY